mgnify:CR=1 FL=1
MMIVDPLIKTIPSEGDTAGINELYNDILNNPFARNIVFSSDMTSASITAISRRFSIFRAIAAPIS